MKTGKWANTFKIAQLEFKKEVQKIKNEIYSEMKIEFLKDEPNYNDINLAIIWIAFLNKVQSDKFWET